MTLRSVLREVFVAVLLALTASLVFLVDIRRAEQAVRYAFDARHVTRDFVGQLVQEKGLLARFVQIRAIIGQARYFATYHETPPRTRDPISRNSGRGTDRGTN